MNLSVSKYPKRTLPNVFDYFLSSLFVDLAIDLGTSNTRVHIKNKGIVLNEPTVIAQHKQTGKIVAVGKQAEDMLGRAPKNIVTSRPLEHGVISDFDMTQALIGYFFKHLRKQPGRFSLPIFPRVLIGVPAGITEVERKAVVDAGLNAGARKVFLVEEPMAAAVGAELPIDEAKASMILDIGAGTAEVAVVSWGGVVVSRSTTMAGDEFNSTIANFIRERHNVLVGDMSAERLKRKINIMRDEEGESLTIRGRNLNSGLPKEIVISRENIREALLAPVRQVAELVRDIIEETPPELVSDLVPRGLVISGGGAQLLGIDRYLSEVLEIPVRVADNPDLCVIKGLAKILDDRSLLEKVQVAWGH